MDDGRCPNCRSKDWHNAYLCRTCGIQAPDIWKSYVDAGYIVLRKRRVARRRKLRKQGIEMAFPKVGV